MDIRYKTLLGTALLAAIALASCSKSSIHGGKPDGDDREIRLRTSISALTKTPDLGQDGSGNFSSGDVFSLGVYGESAAPVYVDYTVGKTVLYWDGLGLTEGGKVSFSGCYPVYKAGDDGLFTFNSDGNTDLLLAKSLAVDFGSSATVPLIFSHALHKLEVEYVSDGSVTEEDLDGVETVLTALSSCVVDMKEGIIKDGSGSASAEYESVTGSSVSFLLVPQDKDNVSLKITCGSIEKTFILPSETSEDEPLSVLEGGCRLKVRISVSRDGIVMDGLQIEGWNPQGTVNGDITLTGI